MLNPIPLCIDTTARGSAAVTRLIRMMRERGALVLAGDGVSVVVVDQKALNDDPYMRELRSFLCDELCVLELQKTSPRAITQRYAQWRTETGRVA